MHEDPWFWGGAITWKILGIFSFWKKKQAEKTIKLDKEISAPPPYGLNYNSLIQLCCCDEWGKGHLRVYFEFQSGISIPITIQQEKNWNAIVHWFWFQLSINLVRSTDRGIWSEPKGVDFGYLSDDQSETQNLHIFAGYKNIFIYNASYFFKHKVTWYLSHVSKTEGVREDELATLLGIYV